MTDGINFSDTFDREGSGKLGSDYLQETPWDTGRLHYIGEAETPSATCLVCGHTVTLQHGESIPYGDPRLCEHAGRQP